MRKAKSTIYFLTLFLVIMSTSVNGQDKKKSAEEEELEKQLNIAKLKNDLLQTELNAVKTKKELEDLNAPPSEKEKAETDKLIAEARKATFQANRDVFKGPEVTVPTGKITGDGTFIESRVLVQQAMKKSFEDLVKSMKAAEPFKSTSEITLILYNQADFPAIELYASMRDQLKSMETAYKRVNQNTKTFLERPIPTFERDDNSLGDPLLVGYAAAGVLRTAADIVSLFRTTTDFKNFDIDIDQNNMVAILKEKMEAKWKLYDPSSYPINTVKENGATSSFISLLNEIQKQSDQTLSFVDQLQNRIKTVSELESKETNEAKKTRMNVYLKRSNEILAELKSLNNSLVQLQTTLSAVDNTTKVTAQSLIMRAERVFTKLNGDNTYVIKLSVHARGSNKISENLWRNARIEHSGGTELSCVVYGADGEVIYAQSVYTYLPYKAASDIK